MDLSIIIVNWNTKKLLARCLESIIKFTDKIKYEIIVIDNGSDDGSIDMLKSTFPSLTLVQNNKNLGFSKAVNQGLTAGKGNNVLMLNSDTYINENTFEKMVNVMKKNAQIGAMTCKVLYPDGKPQSAYCRFPNLFGAVYEFISLIQLFNHSKIFIQYDVTQWDYSKSTILKDELWPGGGCLMVRSDVIKKVGNLDENYGLAYLEDTDLCYRIKKSGYSFYYLAEASIYHYHGFTTSKSSPEFKDILTLNLQRNRHYFFKKHYSSVHLLILKTFDMFKNILIESYLLLTYTFNLKNKDINKKKIKLYLKLIKGCF